MEGVRTTPTRKDTHLARTCLPPPSFIHVSTRIHTLMGVWWWAHTDISLSKTGLEKRKGAETPDLLAFAPPFLPMRDHALHLDRVTTLPECVCVGRCLLSRWGKGDGIERGRGEKGQTKDTWGREEQEAFRLRVHDFETTRRPHTGGLAGGLTSHDARQLSC